MTGASSHASKKQHKQLVPITREFLREFYLKYPLEPVPAAARDSHVAAIEELSRVVTKPGSKVPAEFHMDTPTRIDDCFWRNRMICEELALSISRIKQGLAPTGGPAAAETAAVCDRMQAVLVQAERDVWSVQETNTSSVRQQLKQFIPQDFRGALLERQRVAGEAKYKKQIDDLVKRGGTIRARYDLCLQHQWERRQSLVQLGECSGMYKIVIKWVAGIPQVLLDFAKEINAKLGPMEEQRIKYGPDLYGITTLGLRLTVCLAAWAEAAGGVGKGSAATPAARDAAPHLAAVVEPAVAFYVEHMLRVIKFIGNVFQHSPFILSKEDLEHGGAAAAAAATVGAANGEHAGPEPAAVSATNGAAAVHVTAHSAVANEAAGAAVGAAAAVAVTTTSGAEPAAAHAPIDAGSSDAGAGSSAGVSTSASASAAGLSGAGSLVAPVTPAATPPDAVGRGALLNSNGYIANATAPAAASAPVPAPAPAPQHAQAPPHAESHSGTLPPRPSPLNRHDTPSPTHLLPSPNGRGLVTPEAALLPSPGVHRAHGAAPPTSGGFGRTSANGGRVSLTGDSQCSFTSAPEDAPWHHPESGYHAASSDGGLGIGQLFLGCLGMGSHGRTGAGAGAAPPPPGGDKAGLEQLKPIAE
ncbi:hypothetical protein HXX76_013545 [Chlamydomonas incerta]|uniref:Uncharacterized protein n=1 Tax=Chlamydomonas incerta TaxID=51695 RepID=A0A835SLK0_CHLIN|nr:hypothetical protein HXX76_013545 [Chlamydomonas incerta]|eukprot:KAG2425703.1 hypothetical protein HXX76_013545 [Chlamydomonas incerta]